MSIREDYGFDQLIRGGRAFSSGGETIGIVRGRRIYHNKLEIGIIEPVGKMGSAAARLLKSSSSEEERDLHQRPLMWPFFKGQMCGHKIEVKLFPFFSTFFLKLKLHITTTMILGFVTQTFLRCSSVAGSANCWSIGLLSDSSLHGIRKCKEVPKKNSIFATVRTVSLCHLIFPILP